MTRKRKTPVFKNSRKYTGPPPPKTIYAQSPNEDGSWDDSTEFMRSVSELREAAELFKEHDETVWVAVYRLDRVVRATTGTYLSLEEPT